MRSNISFSELMSLLPVMSVAITVTLVFLITAFKRNHVVVAGISLLGLAVSAILLIQQLCNFVAPIGLQGLFVIDTFGLFYMLLIVLCAMACCVFSFSYLDNYSKNREELYILMLASVVGAMLMTISTHYISFFISLETMSIPVYGMLAYTYQRERSLEAGIKYLVLSATASAMLLMGLAYIYAYTGEMEFVASALKIINVLYQPLVVLGLALVAFACAFKLSLAPFHKWTADVYQGAATPMVIFLASAAKVAMLGLFVRYFLLSGSLFVNGLFFVLLIIAAFSILVGNLSAVMQNDLKRLLAYSSVAHFGYILAALLGGQVAGLHTITMYIIVYAITTLGAFGVISILSSPYRDEEVTEINNYKGLFWKHPTLAIVLAVMLLSLAGVPLTAGFIAKFEVFRNLILTKQWILITLLIVGSGIGLYYYLRAMIILFKKPDAEVASQVNVSLNPITMSLVSILALVVLFVGIYPQPVLELVSHIGIAVLGVH